MFDDHEFMECIGNALFIHERTPQTVSVSPTVIDPFFVEQRLERWQHIVTNHSDMEWQSYLTGQGWQQADLVRLCGQPLLRQLPGGDTTWITVLWHAWESVLAPDHWQEVRSWYGADQASDDDIAVLLPFLSWCQQQLYPRGTKAATALPDEPRVALQWVGELLIERMHHQATRWAAEHASRHHEWRRTPAPSLLMYADGWHDFGQSYPWMMRYLAEMTHATVEVILDASMHLVEDWLALRQHGGITRVAQVITKIGKAPTAYTMVGGCSIEVAHSHTVIYVPQQAPNTHILASILDWLQRRGAPEIVLTPRHVQGHRHQWVILPELQPTHANQYSDYAQHIGAFAALCDILGITRLTPHDMLACGEVPCVLDATSIGTDMRDQAMLAHQILWSLQHPQPEYTPVCATSMAFLAGVSEQAHGIDDWAEDVITGYQRYYDFVAQRRDSLYLFVKQLDHFSQRFWPHSYHDYAACLQQLTDWEHTTDGFEASLQFEAHLQRRHMAHEPWYALIETALRRGQIPAVFQPVDPTGICANLTRMGALHRITHAAHIHYALTRCDTHYASGRSDWHATQSPLLASDALAQEALQLAQHIAENRIGMPAGDTWLVLGHSERDGTLRLADSSLIDGNSGIGLCLAALSILPGGEPLALHAQRAFDYAIEQNTRQPQHLGGLCYAVAQSAARLPQAQRTIERCLQLIRQHSEPATSAHWVDGQAGLVIGLTALQRVMPDTSVFGIALSAGERLLQSRQRTTQGERTWYDEVLTNGGFGSSGVLLALVRLYEMCQDYRFLRAALDIVQYEDQTYDEQRGGWPDTHHEPLSFPITWCYGSVGVGMGRLALLPHLAATPTPSQDQHRLIELLDGIDSVGLHEEDGLCCGSAGAIDTMLSVARALNHTHYVRRSTYWMTQMIERAHARGGYVCHGTTPGIYEHPGLWQGTAGIAYQIARCAYPRLFPSLLANEFRRSLVQSGDDGASGVR